MFQILLGQARQIQVAATSDDGQDEWKEMRWPQKAVLAAEITSIEQLLLATDQEENGNATANMQQEEAPEQEIVARY